MTEKEILFEQETAQDGNASQDNGDQHTADPDTGSLSISEHTESPSETTQEQEPAITRQDIDNLMRKLHDSFFDNMSINAQFKDLDKFCRETTRHLEHLVAQSESSETSDTPSSQAMTEALTNAIADLRHQAKQAARGQLFGDWKQIAFLVGIVLVLVTGGTLSGAAWGTRWFDNSHGWKDAIWQAHGNHIRDCYREARRKGGDMVCSFAVK